MRTNDELLMEGIFDRMRANSAGRKAERDAGVGLGTKVLATGAKFADKLSGGNIGNTNKFQKKLDKGSIAKSSAQVTTLAKEYMKKLKGVANDFATDIKKLNVDISMIDNDSARTILSDLMKYDLAQDIPVREIGQQTISKMNLNPPVKTIGQGALSQMKPAGAPKMSAPVTRADVRKEQEAIKAKKNAEAARQRREKLFAQAKNRKP